MDQLLNDLRTLADNVVLSACARALIRRGHYGRLLEVVLLGGEDLDIDLYRLIAALEFGTLYAYVTPQMRKCVKIRLYSALYGGSPWAGMLRS